MTETQSLTSRQDIVLNCPKIRETSWVDLLSLDETKFGLPDNVDSSERLT